ncbi:MAG: hypothetical protein GY754_07990 [bacterium]|nr:hypothetical protein [bacterium]
MPNILKFILARFLVLALMGMDVQFERLNSNYFLAEVIISSLLILFLFLKKKFVTFCPEMMLY